MDIAVFITSGHQQIIEESCYVVISARDQEKKVCGANICVHESRLCPEAMVWPALVFILSMHLNLYLEAIKIKTIALFFIYFSYP